VILLRLLDVVSIVLAALVAGVFWGPWLALTRSIRTLTPDVFLVVVHRLDQNLGRIMSVLFPATMLVLIADAAFSFGHPISFVLTVAAFALFLLALIVTAAVEVPIVKQIRGWTGDTIPANWTTLRDRWVSFHLLRVVPGILGLALLVAGALWQS
jgi:uncharacterized membrane protein